MSQLKSCKQCNTQFEVIEDDLKFYKKISPTFSGKIFEIPTPSFCPQCRLVRRMVWRNEKTIYKNQCLLCSKEIISVYSPDKNLKVICQDCFWSDRWDQFESGQNISANKKFFEQFDELLNKSFLLALFSTNLENCAYCNQEINSANSYMCTGGNDNRDCFYCTSSIHGTDMSDCWGVGFSEKVHDSVFSVACFNCEYLYNCHMCNDCILCTDCVGCDHCFGSTNLRYKKYYFFNEQLPKQEYLKRIQEYTDTYDGMMEAKARFKRHKLKFPYKFVTVIASEEGCTGDVILNCKNVKDSYYSFKSENARYVYIIAHMKDVMDILSTGTGELSYEIASSTKPYGSAFFSSCDLVSNSYYCYNCTNSSDLFGCVSLNKKQYCIFNKQYSKEEYEQQVGQLIVRMTSDGEWGEFFPTSISPFGYNESGAMFHFPLNEQQAKKIGAKWQGRDYSMKYDGPFYEPKDIREYSLDKNPKAEEEIKKCSQGIIKCEVSGKPFRIVPQELALHIKNQVQLPRKHPDIRYKEQLEHFNKMNLYHRRCMCVQHDHGHNGPCQTEFDTTYEIDQSEIVYCESCYQKEVV